ncbi:MAG: hypothetical protein RI904_1477 [Pseudomonadota bacterium]
MSQNQNTVTHRTLIQGGMVVSMDADIGVIQNACVDIADGRIVSVGSNTPYMQLQAYDEVIHAQGMIVFPGLINAHMHTWQTALRSMASNWTLMEYFRWMHAGLGTLFTPSDIGIATYAGALNQINCGTTTLVDWCHNNPTPEHTDAAVDALARSGIRAAFFHGSPKPDPKPGQKAFWEIAHPRNEIERLKADARFKEDGLLTLGMAILGPHYASLEVALADFRLAKDMGLIASMHQGGGAARAPDGWDVLERESLLGSHINIVHGNDLSDHQMDRFVGLGVSFSLTPENEMTQGHGHPILGRLRQRGVAPSIGIDLESGLSGEMLLAARIAMVHQRALDNAAFRAAATSDGPVIPPTTTLRTEQALRWVTTEGARMLGQLDQIGSITPGKKADLIMIDSRMPNMQPIHDPFSTVLMQTSLANIDSVMVGGIWRKRHGHLVNEHGHPLDTQAWLPELQSSGHRLARDVNWHCQAMAD